MKEKTFGLKVKKLDPKFDATKKYFLNLEIKIQEIAKKVLKKDDSLSETEYKLLADYALATLHDDWENLTNRGYSLLHQFCWRYWHGDAKEAIDPYGYKIEFDKFGSYEQMWNVDHVWPFSKGGLTVIENGVPTSYQANEIKGDNISGKINGNDYKVTKIKTKQGPIGELEINGKKIKPKGVID